MTARLHLDFETRSAAKFGKGGVGLYRYAEHPTTGIWCFAWWFGDGPVSIWWRDEPLPLEVIEHVRSGGAVVAHNAPFERRIWNIVLYRMCNGYLPLLAIEQMDCTMARALAMGLPDDLAKAAMVVRAPHQKDASGKTNMEQMAAPRSIEFSRDTAAQLYAEGALLTTIDDHLEYSRYRVGGLWEDVMTIRWWYDADRRAIHTSYCKTDVLAEHGVDVVVPALSPSELDLWRLNEKINDRGFPIDVPLMKKVRDVVNGSLGASNRRMWTLTNGAVKKCTEHARLKDWLEKRGIKAFLLKGGELKQSVGKGVTGELIAMAGNDLVAKEAIELHNGASEARASKMVKALEVKNNDDRIRGCFRYHKAGPGRFAATIWQAHNLVRVDEDSELPTVRVLAAALEKFDTATAIEFAHLATGRTLHWMAKMERATLRAKPGKIFHGADLSNIEGRVNAWLAGEQWKLDAFAAFDRGEGHDLYKVTAGSILNIDPGTVTKLQRQTLGKVPDLAGGYQGSVMAYVTMGATLGVKVEDIADVAAQTTDPKVWAATAKSFRDRFSCGLEQSVWTGLKVVVNAWRERHPMIVQSWWDRQDAAIQAVSNPGQIVDILGGRIRYLSQNGFLFCYLSSGRVISYPQPEIVRVKYIKEEKQEIDGVEVLVEVEAWKNAVQVWGIEKGQWVPYTLYGGIQCENDDQGFSRDVFSDGGKDLDALGYNLVFHCHDEWLSEDDLSFGSTTEMEIVLSKPRGYAPGLPLAAKAWADERYVK